MAECGMRSYHFTNSPHKRGKLFFQLCSYLDSKRVCHSFATGFHGYREPLRIILFIGLAKGYARIPGCDGVDEERQLERLDDRRPEKT